MTSSTGFLCFAVAMAIGVEGVPTFANPVRRQPGAKKPNESRSLLETAPPVTRGTRHQAIVDECLDHAASVLQVASTPQTFQAAIRDLCGPEFLKIETRVTAEVGMSVLPGAPELATAACQSGADAIASVTDMSGIAQTFCSTMASNAISALSAPSLFEDKVVSGKFACFPEDATVVVKRSDGVYPVALRDVRPGEDIQAADMRSGELFFTQLLTDFHSEFAHSIIDIDYIMLVHRGGSLNVTSEHLIATSDRGWAPARTIAVSDRLLVQNGGHLVTSEIVAVRHVAKRGLYGPLTWSGVLLVNSVLASSYAAPPAAWATSAAWADLASTIGWHGIHNMEHMGMFPFRLAHAIALPQTLEIFATVPGAKWLQAILTPCSNSSDWPEYIRLTGSLVGSAVAWLHPGLSLSQGTP